MPQGVIQVLEVVYVHRDQHPNRVPRAVHRRLQRAPVGQSRQPVGLRLERLVGVLYAPCQSCRRLAQRFHDFGKAGSRGFGAFLEPDGHSAQPFGPVHDGQYQPLPRALSPVA